MKRITCLVDNAVQHGSPFWGEHGLALLIETDGGCALFDTGASGTVLLHNQRMVGDAWREPAVVVLSHAHTDHTGGLRTFLATRPGRVVYAHPDIYQPRFSVRETRRSAIGLPLMAGELNDLADVRLSQTPVEVAHGLWTTGEIGDRAEREGRSSRHVIPAGDVWVPDPYRDDMSLVLELRSGVAVICGCCHAGLLNTLRQVHAHFRQPVALIIGGIHLLEAEDQQVAEVARLLAERYESPRLVLNHCTGDRAIANLAYHFGDRVQPFPAGATLALQ